MSSALQTPGAQELAILLDECILLPFLKVLYRLLNKYICHFCAITKKNPERWPKDQPEDNQ